MSSQQYKPEPFVITLHGYQCGCFALEKGNWINEECPDHHVPKDPTVVKYISRNQLYLQKFADMYFIKSTRTKFLKQEMD